jgi:Uncharacterised protein family UPF0047
MCKTSLQGFAGILGDGLPCASARTASRKWGVRAVKSYTEYLTFNIPSKMAFVNITPEVEKAVRKSGVQEGLVLCNSMHITASVFINDDEAGLHHDFGVWPIAKKLQHVGLDTQLTSGVLSGHVPRTVLDC